MFLRLTLHNPQGPIVVNTDHVVCMIQHTGSDKVPVTQIYLNGAKPFIAVLEDYELIARKVSALTLETTGRYGGGS